MKKKLIILGLAFIMLFFFFLLTACANLSNADLLARIEALEAENERLRNEVSQLEKELEDMSGKIQDPGGEFEYERVTVLLTAEASVLDKIWTPSDFPEFAFSEIENSGLIGNQRFLILYLAEPSRDNVLRAIYYLNKKPEVYIAEISFVETPGL
jgi:predicted nuclease with TOPRIM domain